MFNFKIIATLFTLLQFQLVNCHSHPVQDPKKDPALKDQYCLNDSNCRTGYKCCDSRVLGSDTTPSSMECRLAAVCEAPPPKIDSGGDCQGRESLC
jgi:hypothetical protein